MMIDRVAEESGGEIDYTLLSDPDHAVIDRYGVFNPDATPNRPIPHPTVMVIDRDGVVRWRFTETDYRIRAENEMILDALAEVQEGVPAP